MIHDINFPDLHGLCNWDHPMAETTKTQTAGVAGMAGSHRLWAFRFPKCPSRRINWGQQVARKAWWSAARCVSSRWNCKVPDRGVLEWCGSDRTHFSGWFSLVVSFCFLLSTFEKTHPSCQLLDGLKTQYRAFCHRFCHNVTAMAL